MFHFDGRNLVNRTGRAVGSTYRSEDAEAISAICDCMEQVIAALSCGSPVEVGKLASLAADARAVIKKSLPPEVFNEMSRR